MREYLGQENNKAFLHPKTKKKVGIIEENIFPGIDTIKLVLENKSLRKKREPIRLKNLTGSDSGIVEVYDGRAEIAMCLPKYVRKDNVRPFSCKDMMMIDAIKTHMISQLHSCLGDLSGCFLKSVEVNQTLQVAENCSCSQLLNLLNRCYEDTITYQGSSPNCRYLKELQTLIYRKKNYYVLKCYNKTLEQHKNGNLDVEEDLARIEIIFQDRTLKRLFGSNIGLEDILNRPALSMVIEEYKRIFVDDIIEKHVVPGLKGMQRVLFVSLTQTNSVVKTLALYREIVVDDEVLRRALKAWYEARNMSDNSRQEILSLKKFNLPQNVIKTLKQFHKSCC